VNADPPTQPIMENKKKKITSESDKELHAIIDDMFDVLFQKRSESAYVKPVDIIFWLQKLEEYKKKNPEDVSRVLFLEGECHYRTGNLQTAYSKFYQFKVRMESTNNPLYNFVEARLSELSKNIKFTSLESKPSDKNIIFEVFLIMILIISIIFIYLLDRSERKRSKIGVLKYEGRVVPTPKIITLEEMCQQDGRCSEDAVTEYRQLIEDNNWENIAENKKEGLKFARLIAEGHAMINLINDEKAPWPIKLISKVSIIGNLPLFWRYTFSGAIFIGLWWLVGYTTELTLLSNKITYFLLAAFVISSLYGIHLMAGKTIDAIDELVCMLEPEQEPDSIKCLQLWIERLFNSIRQLYFPIIILAIIIYLTYNDKELFINGKFNLDILFSSVLVFLTSTLIWFLFGSLIMMNNIFNLKDLSINPLSPSKTIGLEKWISVIGTYNMVCSIVLTFGCSIPVYMDFVEGGNLAQGSIWFFIIAPILIFAWIYPYIKIGTLVKSKKMKRMNFIKNKISKLFNEWVESENEILKYNENLKTGNIQSFQTIDSPSIEKEKKKIWIKLEGMENYYKVFKKIEESPESYLDLNSALELAKVLGFPSLFALVSALLSYALK
jgi:hypothetical protein